MKLRNKVYQSKNILLWRRLSWISVGIYLPMYPPVVPNPFLSSMTRVGWALTTPSSLPFHVDSSTLNWFDLKHLWNAVVIVQCKHKKKIPEDSSSMKKSKRNHCHSLQEGPNGYLLLKECILPPEIIIYYNIIYKYIVI